MGPQIERASSRTHPLQYHVGVSGQDGNIPRLHVLRSCALSPELPSASRLGINSVGVAQWISLGGLHSLPPLLSPCCARPGLVAPHPFVCIFKLVLGSCPSVRISQALCLVPGHFVQDLALNADVLCNAFGMPIDDISNPFAMSSLRYVRPSMAWKRHGQMFVCSRDRPCEAFEGQKPHCVGVPPKLRRC